MFQQLTEFNYYLLQQVPLQYDWFLLSLNTYIEVGLIKYFSYLFLDFWVKHLITRIVYPVRTPQQ